MPAAIINSFDIEMTQDVVSGFTLAVIAAIVIHIVLLIVDVVCRRVFKCTDVEQASIVYSNAANLIIPIVSYIIGVIKYICLVIPVMNTEKILLISFLASMTPSAATIIQFAQLNNKDAEYAVAINIVTTLACLITMPIFVAIYQM